MKSLVEISNKVRRGEWKAVDMVRDAYARIDARNAPLNAFIMTNREQAHEAAEAVDAKVARGEDPGMLAGVPFGVKDIEDTIGYRTTQGCVFLLDTPPKTADSPHVERLKKAGAIVVGKTATAEFGMDSAVFTKAWGVTRNPWNTEMTPGGSSGGSSAAVAAGIVPFATSTDGGGSIRQPAAFTNLVGLKPSHGRIAKSNGFANWAVHGTVTRSVAEHARYLDVAAGPDDRDRQSLPQNAYRYEDVIETFDVSGLRAVFTPDCGYAVVEPEVIERARDAATKLIAAAKLVELNDAFHPTNILRDWGAVNLGNLEADFIRDGFLPDGFDKLAVTTQFFLNRMRSRQAQEEIDIKKSWKTIEKLNYQVADFFKEHDLLMSPATGCRPYKADSPPLQVIDGRDASETGVEPFGMLANACWNPSISIPAGFTLDGLPVGLQITARRHRDDILLRLARIFEQAHPWTYPWD